LLGFSRNNRQAQTGLAEGYSLEEKTSKGKGMLESQKKGLGNLEIEDRDVV